MNPKHPSTLYKFLKIFTVERYVLNIFNGATNSLFLEKKRKEKKKNKKQHQRQWNDILLQHLKITANLNFTLPKKIPFDNEAAITIFRPDCLKQFMTSSHAFKEIWDINQVECK